MSVRLFLAVALFPFLLLRSQEPVFRSRVSLVRVDAQVTDGGRTVDGLERDDFVVKDNDRPRSILYFSQDDQPLDLLLLFDISASMLPGIRTLAASSQSALAELRPGDRVAIADFNTQTSLMAPFSGNLREVEDSVGRVPGLRFGGGTHILAAIHEAAGYFPRNADREGERRRAILIFTDDDGQSSMSEKRVVDRLWASDILVCGLVIPTLESRSRKPNRLVRESMAGVVSKTGGELLHADQSGKTFQEILRRVRKRYSIYYETPPGLQGMPREVSVELSESAQSRYPGARILARKGYVIPN